MRLLACAIHKAAQKLKQNYGQWCFFLFSLESMSDDALEECGKCLLPFFFFVKWAGLLEKADEIT
jgi:hypothetical protein